MVRARQNARGACVGVGGGSAVRVVARQRARRAGGVCVDARARRYQARGTYVADVQYAPRNPKKQEESRGR